MSRKLFDRAGFWIQIGIAATGLGALLIVLGTVNLSSAQPYREPWFVMGVALAGLGALALCWSLILYTAHRHSEAHVSSGQHAAVPEPRRSDRREELLNHRRVGEELLAEGDLSEAGAQVWTDSVQAFLRRRGVMRRWFRAEDVEAFLIAGTGTNRERMPARLDVLGRVIENTPAGLQVSPSVAAALEHVTSLSIAMRIVGLGVEFGRSRAQLGAIGVLVVAATYGDPDERTRRIDASAIVKSLVTPEGKLHFVVENDVFGRDPAPGVVKTLEIGCRTSDHPELQLLSYTEYETVDLS
jgi:hypothetical protein